jgi:hypothetical protein
MTELSTEQAFAALEAVQQRTTDPEILEPLRLALVRLRELEAQPAPQEPTDEELLEMMPEPLFWDPEVTLNAALKYAHAVLDRWGREDSNG